MNEPMSAERLAKIKEKARKAACGKYQMDGMLFCRIYAPALFDEIHRLKQENAQLCDTIVRDREANREIGEAIASENAALRAELEAAKWDLHTLSDEYKFCDTCKYCGGDGVDGCTHPQRFSCDAENFYEWRGVTENGGANGRVD